MEDDGLDGTVIGKLLKLFDGFFWGKDHAIKINNRDLSAGSLTHYRGPVLISTYREVDEGKDCQKEKEEGASAYNNPG